METLLVWVAVFLIPAAVFGSLAVFGTLLGGGPVTLLLAVAVGFAAPLITAHWAAERFIRHHRC